jgi:hypothetical protein
MMPHVSFPYRLFGLPKSNKKETQLRPTVNRIAPTQTVSWAILTSHKKFGDICEESKVNYLTKCGYFGEFLCGFTVYKTSAEGYTTNTFTEISQQTVDHVKRVLTTIHFLYDRSFDEH